MEYGENKKISSFEVPVVIFFFKRKLKTVEIIKRLSEIRPKRLYLLCDGGRTVEENLLVNECREEVEKNITWECDIIKKYSDINIGVYENIGEGSKWVLKREKWAIFLEDDNLPETTFFRFCEELLCKYEDDNRILWICGSNYLKKYIPKDGSSYVFTKHMLPCGWASWSDKFLKFYDGNLTLYKDEIIKEKVLLEYNNSNLRNQDKFNWDSELNKIELGKKPSSWDYQMSFALRANNVFGIVPKYNQIRNIGVDNFSIHGGNSLDLVMTKRFCELPTYKLEFPLLHPKVVLTDKTFEKKISKIIVYPFAMRIKMYIANAIKMILGMDYEDSITDKIKVFINK